MGNLLAAVQSQYDVTLKKLQFALNLDGVIGVPVLMISMKLKVLRFCKQSNSSMMKVTDSLSSLLNLLSSVAAHHLLTLWLTKVSSFPPLLLHWPVPVISHLQCGFCPSLHMTLYYMLVCTTCLGGQ